MLKLIFALNLFVSSSFVMAGAFQAPCDKIISQKGQTPEVKRLHALFSAHWEYSMKEFPEWATYVGYPGQNDRWTDLNRASINERKKDAECRVKAITSISRAQLPSSEWTHYDLFRREAETELEASAFPGELMPIGPMEGINSTAANLLESMPREKLKDYEDRLSRLKSLPRVIDQTIALMEEGIQKGITFPKIIMRDVPELIGNQITEKAEDHPTYRTFLDMPESISKEAQARIQSQARELIANGVNPAFKRLKDFVAQSYIPKCRETINWESLPNGKAWYSFAVRKHTTTDMSPDQIHELGLSEVKRIRGEMEEVKNQIGFKGTLEEFFKHLRSDSKFYFKSGDELMMAYRDIAKRIDPELPRLFGKLPRLTYGVKPVPSYSEKTQTTAYYEPGSPKAGRAGNFFANTYAVNTRPKWEMEALTLHEAVPGHHLQTAIAQELEGFPEFRKDSWYTAFGEGWGLYSESLGKELGLYKDPYSYFGRLTYEIWRAIRLVVDTGMHHKGWTRDQAIEYFMANAGKTKNDITVEVDRYISWPGQALAYKIGELKLKELRARASKELGDKFQIRKFHDIVLENGTLPLSVLEKYVDAWIKRGGK